MKLYGVYKEIYDEDEGEVQKVIVAVFKEKDKANKYKDYISIAQDELFDVDEMYTIDDWVPRGYAVGTITIRYTVTPNFAARTVKINEPSIYYVKRIEPLCYTIEGNPVYQVHIFDDSVVLDASVDYNVDETEYNEVEEMLRNNCEGVLSRIVDKMNEGVYNLATLEECLK